MEIVLYKPEIAGNVGACIRLSANTGLALNLIKPFGFSFQENKIRRAGLDYHDLASVSVFENWNNLKEKFAKRNISIKFLSDFQDEKTPSESKRIYTLKSGINKDIAKEIVKDLKGNFKKIQSSIQDGSIRVSGKKRDELQEVISFIKSNDYNIYLNYGNFRD